ncbi:hypothetical protein [Arcanobacterium hippocoleae]|uniref:hypothetical protein n=1 Tax=Arcanobacterium hippocoleae TaxID=149017 RepID=UPI00334059CF
MKIVVLYKWAPDPQNASANADGVIDWGAKRTISEYDPVAIHAARIFADSLPESTELIGITAGEASAASPKATQAAASRGLDSLLVIADDALKGATADVYARVLSAAIKKSAAPISSLPATPQPMQAAKPCQVWLQGILAYRHSQM